METNFVQKKPLHTVPQHVAIIMDGNGRWARQQGKERVYGHIQGVESIRNVVKSALKCGVKYLTLYAFSTENWGRPADEVNALMELLCESTARETPALKEQGVGLRYIGNLESLSEKVRSYIAKSEAETADNQKLTLVIAVNYSARWEITRMAQKIAQSVLAGERCLAEITDEAVAQELTTCCIPDPDLLIRTSGEYRLSNFLLWQLAYSELYFTDIYWPEFGEEAFEKALESYAKRDRRYGLLTQQ